MFLPTYNPLNVSSYFLKMKYMQIHNFISKDGICLNGNCILLGRTSKIATRSSLC
jgi:hypothetical protein